jgi:quercetin dioxygenase-like cupin family protein
MYRLAILFYLTFFLLTSCKQDKHEETKIDVIKLLETTESWDGDSLPAYPDGHPKITILKITIPPKTKLEVHKHPVINAGVLLKGELTVVSEANDTLQLKAGDALSELVNKWHYGANNSSMPAEIMVFYAGTEGSPLAIYHN